MAPEAENQEELTLEKVDVAIKAVKADDHDLNPFTVARALGIAPELLFESKEFMGRLIEARRKSQGDSATYSMDSELLLKVKNLEEELAKLIDINQELYDRGSALEDQVLTMESKITDLEQEAETLAMQLQNSWHLGYNKGLSDGQQKSEAKKEVVASAIDEPKIGHVTVEHEPIALESESLTSPDQKQQDQKQQDEAAEVEKEKSSSITEEQKPVELKTKAKADDTNDAQQEDITATGDQAAIDSQQPAAYNDRIYNVVHSSFMGNEKENYSSFSWKEIETVYQYSTVAGRPNINLYFEPFTPAPTQKEQEDQQAEDSLAVLASSVKNTAEAPVDQSADINARTGPLPAFQATDQKAEIEKMLAANQNETQPIPGAAAYFQAKEAAEKASKGYIKADELPDDGLDSPQSLFNDLSSGSLTGGLLSHLDFGPPEPPVEAKPHSATEPTAPKNLRETSDSAPVVKPNDFETATYDGLDALKIDDKVDDLDLDKLDMFEGLEDIDEISQIEVIEDVVLPAKEAQPSKTTSETVIDKATTTGTNAAVSGEDLRNLIKNRIKQADESQTLQAMPAPQASSAEAAPDSYGKIDADALKAGARNKFVGGKASTGGQDVAEAPAASLAAPRVVPPDIRKHCMILGVRPEELTVKIVVDAWKREMSQPGVHPDTGGDTETAIYLNNAKVELVKWIEAQAPKLGKKFGGQTGAKPQESGKPFIMGQKSDKKEQEKGPGKGSK